MPAGEVANAPGLSDTIALRALPARDAAASADADGSALRHPRERVQPTTDPIAAVTRLLIARLLGSSTVPVRCLVRMR